MTPDVQQIENPAPGTIAGEVATPETEPSRPSNFRRLVETAILFIVVIVLIRAIAVEPFGVPTGSMAGTLYGNHKAGKCPRCGYLVVVGSANSANRPFRDPYRNARCPNCDEMDLKLETIRECVGDRLLVDKNVFELRKPRRWEVAVFRCPFDANKPYVKRIVGLPGESVLIKDGELEVNGVLMRKSPAECRAVRVPVFDNNYQPADRGWRVRWRTGPPDLAFPDPVRNREMHEADHLIDGDKLQFPGASDFTWLIYRHWLLKENQEGSVRDEFGYNGGSLPHKLNPVHDFCVEFDIDTGPTFGSVAIGLRDGGDDVTVTIPIGNTAESTALRDQNENSLAAAAFQFQPSRRHHVEFIFFDRRVMLAVDGTEVFPAHDLPPVSQRKPVSRPCWLGAKNTKLTISNFRLYRDIHYAATGGECRNGVYEPWPLAADEYFMLGDNSANSQDSRFWTSAGIPERCFMGKPLLLHQPSHWTKLRNWDVECIDWHRIRWIR